MVARIVSTLVQVTLWLLLTDAFPEILWRDARLTAALALGPKVLSPESDVDAATIMATATLIHFWLSVVYCAAFAALTDGLAGWPSLAVGALLGGSLYLVNLHGFTFVFPWFEVARGWITLLAHVAFGVTATGVSRALLKGV
jgi:hypothetical protein